MENGMAGYFGSERQQTLQRAADENIAWTQTTPGACSNGRALCSDDPDTLGWDTIFELLKRDGAFGFRLLQTKKLEAITAKLAEAGHRLDLWNVFMAKEQDTRQAADAILAPGLSSEFHTISIAKDNADATIPRLQDFMLSNGISPYSASMLLGEFGPAVTIAICDEDGDFAACAHTYLPHNKFSPYHRFAWGGLVTVAPRHRRKRLGTVTNAMIVRAAFKQLGAEQVYELVSEGNMPSQRMVEECGLRLSPFYKSGSVSGTAERITR